MYDIVSVGDATLDVFLDLNEASVSCDINTENCQLCLTYADKIPVEKVTKIPGAGNGSNNAVGSSRLGMRAAMVSIIGDDEVGKMIKQNWKNEDVNVKHVVTDKKRGSNYSTVLNFKGERTILVYHEPRTYRFPKDLGKAEWVYYTSLAAGSEKMHSALLSYVKKYKAKLAFQPGTFQLKLGAEKLKPLIAASEVVFVNKEEAQRIIDGNVKDMKDLLTYLRAMGCKIAVITDGPNGAYAYDGDKYLHLGIYDTPVVERTGVGDSFATAFVAARHYGHDVAEAMRWGTMNSSSVVQKIGPQEGLLTRAKLLKGLKTFTAQPTEF